MTEYNKNLESEIFNLANERYEEIISTLASEKMTTKEHGAVESFLDVQGSELMRCLLQGYLDIRSRDEIKHDSIVGKDGIERTHKRNDCQRQFSTIFGKVTIRRLGYSKTNMNIEYPLDAALNLPADKYSHGLRLIVANSAAKESFDEVVGDVAQYTAGKVPKRQAEQLAQRASQDFDAFYEQKIAQEYMLDSAGNTDDLIVLTTDAKGIVVRREDLRESTRKAADNERHKKQTRLSKGEKKNRKRMAQVASVYDIIAHKRTAQEIMDTTADTSDDEPKKRPKPTAKRVWASIEKDSGNVIKQMFDEADRRDPDRHKEWVVLVDGNQDQIKKVESTAAALNVCVAIVMDFVHVLEYLWKAAYALFGEDSVDVEQWVKKVATKLLESKTSRVAADMRSRATKQKLSEEQRKPIDRCANYLLNNKQRLDYKAALEKGFPIATGVIEGACRYLIKDRMDITGARWSLAGAESVLKLRALRCSNDLDDYMQFHHKQDHRRNYNSDIAA